MTERDARERDILVAANEYAYVQDLTKGDIVLYVGPTKISLSNTERIVELRGDRFVPVRADDGSLGVSTFITASSAQYIVLVNPARDATAKPLRGSNGAVDLLVGRKVVVPGPATFPLWPGQRARVIDGHQLREDEYLVVRYYDAIEGDVHPIGAEIVVRGSDVSFYVPRTGLEVVPDANSRYVRKAWSFPRPGGLHVRITKRAELAEGTFEAGAEVFLKDRDGFFFPSENVEVIGLVLPIPIAEKEGIYVRDRATGRVSTVSGPANFIPDPTREEIVERLLDDESAALYGIESLEIGRAVAVDVPPSFAVLVTGKTRREVVVGPQTRILDYDEELAVLRLSTGRPKSDTERKTTCLLRIDGNKVSDVVRVRTRDHVELDVSLSYRVSFTGDRAKWFNVEDYVGLLCDHLGSILRAAARAIRIEDFAAGATELLRTAILGEKVDGRRPGRAFEENGMWVYDVEVLDVRILDGEVKKVLEAAQRAAIVADVKRRDEERRLAGEQLRASVDRELLAAEGLVLAVRGELEATRAQLEKNRAAAQLEIQRLAHDSQAAQRERDAEIERRALEASVVAWERQMAALAPELVTTLRALGHQALATELSKNVAPLAILGGGSVTEVVQKLLGSLPVGATTSVAEIVRNGTKRAGPQT
jgi:major vault protein